MERAKGIEPSSQPWQGRVLPLNHAREILHIYYNKFFKLCAKMFLILYFTSVCPLTKLLTSFFFFFVE